MMTNRQTDAEVPHGSPYPPAPLHAVSLGSPQRWWLHRGNGHITHTTPTACGRPRQLARHMDVVTGEKQSSQVMKHRENPFFNSMEHVVDIFQNNWKKQTFGKLYN